MRGKVLSILALVLAGCSNQNLTPGLPQIPNERSEGIVNGKDVTTPDLYSQHTVFLQLQMAKGSGSCTGSILDSQTILTAGHCVAGVKEAVVIFASNVQDSTTLKPEQIRNVDVAAVYPKFVPPQEDSDDSRPKIKVVPPVPPPPPTLEQVEQMLAASDDVDYDVAVVHFKGGLPAGYSPVQLATDPSIVKAGSLLHMIGFGLSKVTSEMKMVNGQPVIVPAPDDSTVGQLRETEVAIGQYNTKAGMILTDGAKTSVCSGDSGGPAFMQDPTTGAVLQVGIADAVANAYCNSVSMHTAIFPFLNWIQKMSAVMAKKSIQLTTGVVDASL